MRQTLSQRRQQFFVHAAEAAVTHDDHIEGPGLGRHRRHQGVQVGFHPRRHRRLGDHRVQRPFQPRRLIPDYLIRVPGTGRQGLPVAAQAHGVGTGLDHRQHLFVADPAAQAVQGGGDGRGVVGEVVVDAHAVHFAAQLHAALHALEAAQGGGTVFQGDAHMARRQQRRHGVIDVMATGERPVHHGNVRPLFHHREAGAVRALQPVARVGLLAEPFHLAPAAPRQGFLQGGFAVGQNHPAQGRHGAQQMVKLGLDGGQVRKDIRVVELEIVEHHGARPVMDELAALVEKGGVVLVRFDHEKRRAAKPRGNAEVAGHAADQIAGVEARVLENPGQHGGGGGLAVGAGHRQHPAPRQHHLGEQLGAGGIGYALVQHMLHRRVAPAQGVADHHQVRGRLQLSRVVALDQLDAGGAELLAHRRVDVLVGTGDPVPLGPDQLRQRPHEGAADAENMDVHGRPRSKTRFRIQDARCRTKPEPSVLPVPCILYPVSAFIF